MKISILLSCLSRRRLSVGAVCIAAAVTLPATAVRAPADSDWPCFRANSARTGANAAQVEFPLRKAWRYAAAHAPRPAWPEPGRELHRVDFDYAPQVVAAAGRVFFGSNADDTVRALDLRSGKIIWRFTAGGPVRFAPHAQGNRCWFAADDGVVYCLDASTGRLVWKKRVAPNARRFIGNGRIISRWPCRSGVLVHGGVLYTTAGMWPSETVFVVALDAATGRRLWCNDANDVYMPYPHPTAFSLGGPAPQGYLALHDGVLLVPTGRSVPAAFDASNGRFLYYHAAENKSNGSWWVMAAGGVFLNEAHAWNPDKHARTGEMLPLKTDDLLAFDVKTGKPLWRIKSRQRAAWTDTTVYAGGCGVVEARPFSNGAPAKSAWTASWGPRTYALTACANAVFAGGRDRIAAFDRTNGRLLWQGKVNGEVRSIAVVQDGVVVATDRGDVVAFASAAGPSREPPSRPGDSATASDSVPAPPVVRRLQKSPIPLRGYALVVGEPNARLAESLARETDLHVLCVFDSPALVATERARLLSETDLYGVRIAILESNRPAADLPPFFANVIIVGSNLSRSAAAGLYECLHPYGGRLLFDAVPTRRAKDLLEAAGVPKSERRQEPDGVVEVVRGPLPGAFDWNSDVTSDQRVKWPLELLWFGGPGPARMVSRHWRAPTPVPASGRYFALGEYDLIAVDAYNGAELWSRRIPDLFARRLPVAADDACVYVNFPPDCCVALDAVTGRVRRFFGRRPKSKEMALEPDELQLPVHTLNEAPPHARRAARLPRRDAQHQPPPRVRPIVGTHGPRLFRKSYGCGGIIQSAYADFFRSGTLGCFDYNDDSGVRNLAGVRPGCGMTLIPALGLLIANEGSACCSCSYNFQTSLALAPAKHRRQEDWAVYYDRLDIAPMRTVALNFGAPVDRRDENGTLWLGFPRPSYRNRQFLGLPANIHYFDCNDAGPFRVNADFTPIRKTNRPWVYASQCRGLRSLELAVLYFEPSDTCVLLPCPTPPTIDGELAESCWHTGGDLSLDGGDVRIRTRSDSDHLYIAYERTPVIDRRGNRRPWRTDLRGTDAPVWRNDAFEATFKNRNGLRCLHIGVSAGGARYDAIWEPVFDIPRIEGLSVDGNAQDWKTSGFQVRLKDRGVTRFAWSEHGLFVLFETDKDFFAANRAYTGILMLATRPGDAHFLELAIEPNTGRCITHAFLPEGRSRPQIPVKTGTSPEGRFVAEALFPWQALDVRPVPGAIARTPMLFYNPKTTDPLFPKGTDVRKLLARDRLESCRVRLADAPAPTVTMSTAWYHGAARAWWPVSEQPEWNGDWRSGVQADAASFRAELAIPWKTLADAGLQKQDLWIDVRTHGPLDPRLSKVDQKLRSQAYVLRKSDFTPTPRRYTLRFHFADLEEDARPGQRVFDVQVQGRTVLPNVDVCAAAGGPRTALVREVRNVEVTARLRIEFAPKAPRDRNSLRSAPILNGLEIVEQ